jgi:hypothetical protein
MRTLRRGLPSLTEVAPVSADQSLNRIRSLLRGRELRHEVAQTLDRAMLTTSTRPNFLDRADQPPRAVGDEQARHGDSAAGEDAAEFEPVLLGLAHPQPHRNQLSRTGLGDSPGTDHALLRSARADRQLDRVEEQHDQVDVVERAATERLEPLVPLRADRGHRRLRRAIETEPGRKTSKSLTFLEPPSPNRTLSSTEAWPGCALLTTPRPLCDARSAAATPSPAKTCVLAGT